MQGSEHWVFIEREYLRPEDLGLLEVPSPHQEEREAGLSHILADGRLSKVDILVDKFKVEVATEEMVGSRSINTQRGRMIASPEDFESVWEGGPWFREGPDGEVLLGASQISGGPLESQIEWHQELGELQTGGLSKAPEPSLAKVEDTALTSTMGNLQSFLLDLAPKDTRANSSNEIDPSSAERDSDGCLLSLSQDAWEGPLVNPTGQETRPGHDWEVAKQPGIEAIAPQDSVPILGSNTNREEEAFPVSEQGAGPPKREDERAVFVGELQEEPAPGQEFAEDWKGAWYGMQGEFTHIAGTPEEGPQNVDLVGQAEWKNHAQPRGGPVHPDPQTWDFQVADSFQTWSDPKPRAEAVHEDPRAFSFLQMEVIAPLPTSAEETSPCPDDQEPGGLLELGDPLGEPSLFPPKRALHSKEDTELEDRVATTRASDGVRRRAPPVASKKPRFVPEEATGTLPPGVLFLPGKPKAKPLLQAGGQEGSLEDISKASVANKIRIFETQGSEGLRGSPSDGSAETAPAQLEQQRKKLLELGLIQLQLPRENGVSSWAPHTSAMPPPPRPFRGRLTPTSQQAGHRELDLSSPDSGCETTLEEATGGPGHVSPCLPQSPCLQQGCPAGGAGRMLRSSLGSMFLWLLVILAPSL